MSGFPRVSFAWLCLLGLLCGGSADAQTAPPSLVQASFPPPESKGGWLTLLPDKGDPDADQKARIRNGAGVDWDELAEAWKWNVAGDGASGLLVLRHGTIVGEWYKDCDRDRAFNIYRRKSRPETYLQWDDCRRSLGVNEDHWSITKPWDRRAALVQFRLT
jgi:hypothetical protein